MPKICPFISSGELIQVKKNPSPPDLVTEGYFVSPCLIECLGNRCMGWGEVLVEAETGSRVFGCRLIEEG
jgi:hypothetical protein